MSAPTHGDLINKMRALAGAGHERATDLKHRAAQLEAILQLDASDRDWARRMLGAWARARRVWCECSGEPLV